jgi:nicotinate-nucleotide pyrophosphorylase (carboxylating)
VERVRLGFYERGRGLPLIVEARTPEEAEQAARLGVDQILLDNMEPTMIAAAVAVIRGIEGDFARVEEALETDHDHQRIRIEVSGGVTLETVRQKALPGVDWISVGALTHSAPALDISMEIELVTPAESGPKSG